jgi:hypothetical protein
MGGLVALEMAFQLEKKGIAVERLIMIDSYLQEHFDRFSSIADSTFSGPTRNRIQGNGRNGNNLKTARNGHIVIENSERRDDLAELSREYPDLAGLPVNASSDAVQRLSDLLSANERAIRAYQPGGVYRGDVLYFYGTENGSVAGEKNDSELSADLSGRIKKEICEIWEKYLPFIASKFVSVNSSHYSMMEDPSVIDIAAELHCFLSAEIPISDCVV